MQRNASGQILTGEAVSPDIRAFYVSVLDTSRRNARLVLGPFASYGRAEEHVAIAKRYCRDTWSESHWWAYGVCGHQPPAPYPVGVLNEKLAVTPDAIDDNAPTPPMPVRPAPPPPPPKYFRPFSQLGGECTRCLRRGENVACRCEPSQIRRDLHELAAEIRDVRSRARDRYARKEPRDLVAGRLNMMGALRRAIDQVEPDATASATAA